MFSGIFRQRGFVYSSAEFNRVNHARLERIRLLRNRIAHHEPILSRDHMRDHEEILEVAGWICTDTKNWIADQSRVLMVLQPPWLYRMLGIQ